MEWKNVEDDEDYDEIQINDTCMFFPLKEKNKIWTFSKDKKHIRNIYVGCRQDIKSCNYVIKSFGPFFDKSTQWRQMKNETTISAIASKYKFGVPFIGQFLCEEGDYGGMILEKYDGALFDIKDEITLPVVKKILRLLHLMHTLKIVHLDLHFGNFLYKKDKKGKISDLRIIDFQLSLLFKKKPPISQIYSDYQALASSFYMLDKNEYVDLVLKDFEELYGEKPTKNMKKIPKYLLEYFGEDVYKYISSIQDIPAKTKNILKNQAKNMKSENWSLEDFKKKLSKPLKLYS